MFCPFTKENCSEECELFFKKEPGGPRCAIYVIADKLNMDWTFSD